MCLDHRVGLNLNAPTDAREEKKKIVSEVKDNINDAATLHLIYCSSFSLYYLSVVVNFLGNPLEFCVRNIFQKKIKKEETLY